MEKIKLLETICANKVRVEKKTYLDSKEMNCKENCQGFNLDCKDYYPMEVGYDHYLITKHRINQREKYK